MIIDVACNSVRFERLTTRVALVIINRESARNAIDANVAAGLERAARLVEEDDDIRVAILTGAGSRSFCSGADLKEVAAGRIATFFTGKGGFAGFTRLTRSKPWIAAVNGFAFAGGFEIALACDLIVASETATFALPEVRVGLVAGGGGVLRLLSRLPRNIATELILTGEPLSAQRALALGLVNALVPPDVLITAANGLAEKIAINSPSSIRQSLNIVRAMQAPQEARGWAASDAAMAAVARNSDFVEGPAAFIEQRLPRWTNKESAEARDGEGSGQ